jgi:hypothetical protein
MDVTRFPQPVNRKEPVERRENGDPMPRGAGDNNRGYHVPEQVKGKIFQNLEEQYNNGAAPTTEPGYHPNRVEGTVGPFNY